MDVLRASSAVEGAGAEAVPAGLDLDNGVLLRRRDSGIGDEHASFATGDTEPSGGVGGASGPDAVSEALSALSSEVKRSQEGPAPQVRNVKVKDILRSLVTAPTDDMMVDPGLLSPAFLGPAGDAAREPSMQFRSFDRWVPSALIKTRELGRGLQEVVA